MFAIVIFCALALPRLGAFVALASFIALYIVVIGGITWLFMQLDRTEL
jgi:hypothetical protein